MKIRKQWRNKIWPAKSPQNLYLWFMSTKMAELCCPGFHRKRVHIFFCSWSSAEFWIQYKMLNSTLMFQSLLSSAYPKLRTFLFPNALPMRSCPRNWYGAKSLQLIQTGKRDIPYKRMSCPACKLCQLAGRGNWFQFRDEILASLRGQLAIVLCIPFFSAFKFVFFWLPEVSKWLCGVCLVACWG